MHEGSALSDAGGASRQPGRQAGREMADLHIAAHLSVLHHDWQDGVIHPLVLAQARHQLALLLLQREADVQLAAVPAHGQTEQHVSTLAPGSA